MTDIIEKGDVIVIIDEIGVNETARAEAAATAAETAQEGAQAAEAGAVGAVSTVQSEASSAAALVGAGYTILSKMRRAAASIIGETKSLLQAAMAAAGRARRAAGQAESRFSEIGSLFGAVAGYLALARSAARSAASSATSAANLAAQYVGTATDSIAIGSGTKNFTTQTGKDFNGRDVLVTSDADPTTDFMAGKATYDSGTGALSVDVEQYGGSGTHTDWTIRVSGGVGATGPAGPATVADRVVRVMDVSDSDPATSGYEDGQTIDGVTLATDDLVLRNASGNQARNGVWVVAASGGASRDDDYDTWDEIAAAGVVAVQEGTTYADTLWQFTANAGGTLNTTAITLKEVNPEATDATPGLVELATSAEVATGTDTERAVTPAGLTANYLGQGLHEIGYWPARALKVSTTSGATAVATDESTTNKLNTEYLTFPNGSTTYAELSFRAPKKLDPSASIYVEFEWFEAASASAHVCRWQAEAQAQGDGDTIDSSWGTAVAVDDTGSSGTRRFALTGAITPGGSWAQGDKIIIRLARLGGHANDTLDVSAKLIGATVFASVNLRNDA